MYTHIGEHKTSNGHIHLFYNLHRYVISNPGIIEDSIELPASLLFMGTEPHIFTEFVKRKIVKEYHHKRKEKGYYYYYKGVGKLELIDTIEKLKEFFNISQQRFDELKTKLISEAI